MSTFLSATTLLLLRHTATCTPHCHVVNLALALRNEAPFMNTSDRETNIYRCRNLHLVYCPQLEVNRSLCEFKNVSFWLLVLRWDTDLKPCYPRLPERVEGRRKRECAKGIQSFKWECHCPRTPLSLSLPSSGTLYQHRSCIQAVLNAALLVQENKFVNVLPHLIEALDSSCLFIHNQVNPFVDLVLLGYNT